MFRFSLFRSCLSTEMWRSDNTSSSVRLSEFSCPKDISIQLCSKVLSKVDRIGAEWQGEQETMSEWIKQLFSTFKQRRNRRNVAITMGFRKIDFPLPPECFCLSNIFLFPNISCWSLNWRDRSQRFEIDWSLQKKHKCWLSRIKVSKAEQCVKGNQTCSYPQELRAFIRHTLSTEISWSGVDTRELVSFIGTGRRRLKLIALTN